LHANDTARTSILFQAVENERRSEGKESFSPYRISNMLYIWCVRARMCVEADHSGEACMIFVAGGLLHFFIVCFMSVIIYSSSSRFFCFWDVFVHVCKTEKIKFNEGTKQTTQANHKGSKGGWEATDGKWNGINGNEHEYV
jgi:hypothetical protein